LNPFEETSAWEEIMTQLSWLKIKPSSLDRNVKRLLDRLEAQLAAGTVPDNSDEYVAHQRRVLALRNASLVGELEYVRISVVG
jgi:hypothetical protein